MTRAEETRACYVVTHVHWDREWYRPFEEFRGRLIELVEGVLSGLDSGDFESFHLDGQTIIARDVLELRPDLEERLAAHARAGRLMIGPWHVLADNQLCSAESLVRNLLVARRWTQRLGCEPKVGYSPDAFGHPADLPMVLRGFGLDTALVWRGAPVGVPHFRWVSPDGSEVFAVNQAYHAAEVLWPGKDPGKRVTDFIAQETARCSQGPLLLLDGGDHLFPAGARERIAQANIAQATGDAQAGVRFEEATLAEYFAAVRADQELAEVPLVRGALREYGGYLGFILDGTLSTRIALKQDNDSVFTELERFVEPLVARCVALGDAPLDLDSWWSETGALLDHAWQLALENCPHDSICGCSVDAVHRENHVRVERIEQIAEHIQLRALQRLGVDTRLYGPTASDHVEIIVRNGHGHAVSGPVRARVVTAPDRVVVAGHDGEDELAFEARDLGELVHFEADLDLLPDNHPARAHEVSFVARDVPAFGWRRYVLALGPRDEPDAAALGAVAADPTVSAAAELARMTTWDGCVVELNAEGSLRVTDATGEVFDDVALLVDEGDRGDSYTFDPVPGAIVGGMVRASSVISTPARTAIKAIVDLEIPVGLTADRSARSAETVTTSFEIEVSSWEGQSGLEWNASWVNRACDHRVRCTASVPRPSEWVSDLHWSTQSREFGAEFPPDLPERGYELAHRVAPAQSFVAAPDQIAIAMRGLPEVAGIAEGTRAYLAVTLSRSVGWMSLPDLAVRAASAGPTFETPQAQELTERSASLWLLFGSDAEPGKLAQRGAEHRVPLRARQVRAREAGAISDSMGVPGVEISGALATAWKVAEDGVGTILRVHNPTPHPRHVSVGVAKSHLTEVRLDESELGNAEASEPSGDAAPVWSDLVQPFGVRTFRVRRGQPH